MDHVYLVLFLTAVAGGLLAVRALQSPLRWLVAAYAFTLPFGSSVRVPVGLPHPYNTLSTLIGIATFGGLVVHLALTRKAAERVHPSLVVWILFLGLSGLTYLWSADSAETLRALLLLASLVALHLLISLTAVDDGDLRTVESALMWGGAVTGALALHALLTDQLNNPGHGFPRFGTAGGAAGPGQGDANITAAMLILPLVLAVARIIQGPTLMRRLSSAGAAAAIVFAIMMTGSRGGLLSTLVALAILGWQYRPRWRVFLPLVLIAPVAWLAFVQAPQGLQEHLQATHSSGRLGIWTVALEACESRCLAGGGWGAFADIYRQTSQTSNAGNTNLDKLAHNSWLRALVETGVVGLLLMILATVLIFRDLLRLPAWRRGPPLAGMAALIVSNMFLSTINFKYFWMTFTYAVLALNAQQRGDGDVVERTAARVRSMNGLERLGWGIRRYWPAVIGTAAAVMAIFLAQGLRSWSRPVTYEAAALVIAEDLTVPRWSLPRLGFAVLYDEVLPQLDRLERRPSSTTVRLVPLADTVAMWVQTTAPRPEPAQELANVTARRLASALNETGEVGSFVTRPAAVSVQASAKVRNLMASLLSGSLAAPAMAVGLAGLLVWLRRPLLTGDDVAAVSGLPVLGSLEIPRPPRGSGNGHIDRIVGMAALARRLANGGVPVDIAMNDQNPDLVSLFRGALGVENPPDSVPSAVSVSSPVILASSPPEAGGRHRAAASLPGAAYEPLRLVVVTEGTTGPHLLEVLKVQQQQGRAVVAAIFTRHISTGFPKLRLPRTASLGAGDGRD